MERLSPIKTVRAQRRVCNRPQLGNAISNDGDALFPALAVTVDGDGREAYDARQVNWRASGLVQLRSWVDCPDAVRARQCLAILLPEPLPGRRPGGYGLQLDVSTAGYRLVTGNDGLADAYVIDARMSPEIQPRT